MAGIVRTSTTGAETLRGTVETASYTYATLAFQPPTASSSTTHSLSHHLRVCMCHHVCVSVCVCMFMYVCVLPRLSRPRAGSLHSASRLIISHYSPSLSSPSLSVPHRLTLYLSIGLCLCTCVCGCIYLFRFPRDPRRKQHCLDAADLNRETQIIHDCFGNTLAMMAATTTFSGKCCFCCLPSEKKQRLRRLSRYQEHPRVMKEAWSRAFFKTRTERAISPGSVRYQTNPRLLSIYIYLTIGLQSMVCLYRATSQLKWLRWLKCCQPHLCIIILNNKPLHKTQSAQ